MISFLGIHWFSWILFGVFLVLQLYYFVITRRGLNLYKDFYKFSEFFNNYGISNVDFGVAKYPQLTDVGKPDSDLSKLIKEINNYIYKTKGTTDFAVIQNKVERKLSMRYDQSQTLLSFPTYLGLMGTFLGVFIGIWMFNSGLGNSEGAISETVQSVSSISDESIKKLLSGVLLSMSTSFIGLFLTTWNNKYAGEARKKIEEDKNQFYDFVQTELMPSINVSLVGAIGKLHETVDQFEPAFNRVITSFQTTFDNCTKAFGNNFETNVKAVAGAVNVMGQNMDKINENIKYQKELIQTMRSDEVAKGMDKYIEAANHFVSITDSLNKFEEARRMMLAAAQEAITLQNTYSDSLKIPREVAVRINQILDRVKEFEDSINQLGGTLNKREILGNDVVELIQSQVGAIARKQMIADSYVQSADNKLEDLFKEQTKAIADLTSRYKVAIESHINGFEDMIKEQTEELKNRHTAFMNAIEERLSIEDVRKEFVNLGKLAEIDAKIKNISDNALTSIDIHKEVKDLKDSLDSFKKEILSKLNEEKESSGLFGGLFGNRKNS